MQGCALQLHALSTRVAPLCCALLLCCVFRHDEPVVQSSRLQNCVSTSAERRAATTLPALCGRDARCVCVVRVGAVRRAERLRERSRLQRDE